MSEQGDENIILSKNLQNSIMVKKDSKGNYGWEIKFYFDQDYERTIEKIEHANEILSNKFKGGSENEN